MREIILEHKEIFMIGMGVLILLSLVAAIFLLLMIHTKKNTPKSEVEEKKEKKKEKVSEARRIVCPDGINPNPLSYTVIHDAGHDVYVRSLTIDSLPKRTVFATTFPALFNFDRVTTSVFIEPLGEGRASHLLDGRIVEIETNMITAEKNADRNQLRKLNAKLRDTESWAQRIETGDNSLYHVYFLFVLMADSLEQLNRRTDAFRNLAKENRITLSCCYSLQAESYLTGMPLMYRYSASVGPIKTAGLKRHTMDKLSLASIFNHTQDSFFHEHGIIIGRNMNTGMPVAFDVYEKKHNGYNMVFAGMTGTGKSACMKILASRYITKNGYRFVCIDSQSKGNRGEYTQEEVLNDWLCVNKQGKQLQMTAYRKLLERASAELRFRENYNVGYLHALYGYLAIAFGRKTVHEVAKEYHVSRYYLLNRIFKKMEVQFLDDVICQVANIKEKEHDGKNI